MRGAIIQPDQINMGVLLLYLVKSDLPIVGYCTRIHCTGHFLQGAINTRPCITLYNVHCTMYISLYQIFLKSTVYGIASRLKRP